MEINISVWLTRFYSLFLELEYLLTDKNSLCSDTKNTPVDTEEMCKNASDKIKEQITESEFKGAVLKEHWPRGCYLVTSPSQVWFNLHPVGSSNNQAHHICNIRGKQ